MIFSKFHRWFQPWPQVYPLKLPLRLVLTVPFVLLTIGTTGLVGYLCIRNGQRATADLAHQLMSETGERVNLYLSNYLAMPQLVNRLNASAVGLNQIDITNQQSLQRHFIEQIQAFDTVSRIHFSNPAGGYVAVGRDERGLSTAATGGFVRGTLRVHAIDAAGNRRSLLVEQSGYDASQRPFYQRAVEAKKPVWTPVYVYVPTSRGLGISASYPLYDQAQRLRGVLSSDLTLAAIHQFLSDLRVGEQGTTFIVDRAGQMVASSMAEPLLRTSANRETAQLQATASQALPIRLSTQHLLARFGDLSKIDRVVQFQFEIDGKRQFLQAAPFRDGFGLDWLIVTTVPEADFTRQIAVNTRNTILLSSAALISAVLLGLLIARRIAESIQRFSRASCDLVSGGGYALQEDSPIVELQMLTDSFNQMAKQLQQSFARVNAALQESEEKFTQVFRTCPDPIGIVTLDGCYLEVNDAFVNLFGYSKEEVTGHTAVEIGQWVNPEERQRYVELVQSGQPVRNLEFTFRSKAGKLLTVLFSADRIELLGQPYLVGIAKDITNRKSAELELQQQKELREAIYNESADALFLVDPETLLTIDCNRRAVELFEAESKVELIGIPGHTLQHHPMTLEELDDIVAEMQQKGFWSREVEYITRKGNLFWGNLAAKLVQIASQDIHLVRVTDITEQQAALRERKQAEAALRQSEERNRAILSAIPDLMTLVSAEGIYLASVRSNALVDLITAEVNPVGKHLSEILPAEVAARQLQLIERALATGKIQTVEQQIWIEDRWQYEELRAVACGEDTALIMIRDITERKRAEDERKRAEAALRQSEQLFRGAFETSAFGISIRSLEGRYLRVNQALCQILGYTEAEFLQLSYRDITLPEDLAIDLQNTTEKLLAGEISYYHLEKRFIHKDGHIVWGLVSLSLVRDLQQQPLYFVAQVQDITDRKRTEAALQQSEARFQKIAAASPAQIYILGCSPDASHLWFEYISSGVREIQELEPEQVLQDALLTYQQVHPDDRAVYDEVTSRSFKTLEPFSHEWRIITPSGKVKWVQADSRPERRENGEIVWYGVLLDITDRKQAEEALRQSEARNRAILSVMPDLMKLYTVDGIYLASIKSHSMSDLTPDDDALIGKHVNELVPPDIAATELQLIQKAVATGEVQIYEQQVWFQDTLQYEEVRVVPYSKDTALLLIRNITDRKVAETSLRRSEAALRRAQQVAHIGSWEVDVQTGQITWSEESFHIFGWDVTQPEPSLAQFYELLYPDDCSALQHTVTQAILHGGSYKTEFRIIHPNGSIRYVEARGEAVRNEQGQIEQIIGTNLDITERQQAEAALRQSEATKNQILKAIPDLIIWMTADGICIDMIDGGSVPNLYKKTEAIGKNLYDMLPSELAQARMNAIQQALQTDEVQIYEQKFLIQDKIQYEEVRVISVSGDRILVIVRDITDRKRAEAALLDSETRFRSAFQDAPIGMAIIGLDDCWIKVNPMLCDMLGFPESELLAMTASSLVHPNDIDKLQQCIEQVLSSENRNAQVELRYCCYQGRLAWGLMSLSLVRDAQAQPLYYVAQIQDITERQAIDRMKNEFISIVSHELRTPLTAIRGFLGLLDTGIYNSKPDRAKHMIEQALTNSDRLVRLVNDILDLERLSSGRAQFVMETCEAENLLRQAAAGVQSIADQSAITLTVVSTTAHVWADPDSIIQTLTNLLSNAIKFSPASSVVTLSAQTESEWVRFSVSDQGRGIPADKLETIFGRFQQVDVSDSRQKGGTGLGLAICQSIVQQHGGNIWVESIFGEGSTFYFTLPLPSRGEHD